MGAAEVLTQLFSDTGLEAGLLARRTGKESLKRLHYFLTLAVDPEPLSVHEFLVKLRLMKGKILYYETAGEDVVHILTMHSSKGLEYPVVILGDCCDSFRGKDVRGEMIADDVYGVATKFYDADHMIRRETLQRDLIDERKDRRTRRRTEYFLRRAHPRKVCPASRIRKTAAENQSVIRFLLCRIYSAARF